MYNSEGKDILLLQLVVLLFKMKQKKRRERKKWVRELFRKREERSIQQLNTKNETSR